MSALATAAAASLVNTRAQALVKTAEKSGQERLTTPDWKWQVEVITTRGGQSFRVKRLDRLPGPGSTGLPSPGTLVATTGEVRELLGDDVDRLVEVRDRRFDGGR